MNLFKRISNLEYFKNFISLFLIFFFLGNIINIKANENSFLTGSRKAGKNLIEFDSDNAIKYEQHDKAESQMKMFFGFDPENPEISFYQDLLIIDYSNYVREMYKLKLSDITIKNNL